MPNVTLGWTSAVFMDPGASAGMTRVAAADLDDGGGLFRFDLKPPAVVHPWRPLEEFCAP
jgi:hypothetical protein